MRDRAGDFGAITAPKLSRIRNLWHDIEPLVADTSYDDKTHPTELRVELSDGIGSATRARIDVQWSDLGYYSFYTESARKAPASAVGESAYDANLHRCD